MIGPPECRLLHIFGAYADRAFGHTAYHVGSSLMKKRDWRDVDVRLLLPDDEYDAGYADTGRRRAHELAWSMFGRTLTGLPIDFQIQRLTDANEEFDGLRSALLILDTDLPVVRTEH